jgi:hypothetical protein
MVARIKGREVPVAVEKSDVRHPHAPLEGFAGEINNCYLNLAPTICYGLKRFAFKARFMILILTI